MRLVVWRGISMLARMRRPYMVVGGKRGGGAARGASVFAPVAECACAAPSPVDGWHERARADRLSSEPRVL